MQRPLLFSVTSIEWFNFSSIAGTLLEILVRRNPPNLKKNHKILAYSQIRADHQKYSGYTGECLHPMWHPSAILNSKKVDHKVVHQPGGTFARCPRRRQIDVGGSA